jgi:hypothetical protein
MSTWDSSLEQNGHVARPGDSLTGEFIRNDNPTSSERRHHIMATWIYLTITAADLNSTGTSRCVGRNHHHSRAPHGTSLCSRQLLPLLPQLAPQCDTDTWRRRRCHEF